MGQHDRWQAAQAARQHRCRQSKQKYACWRAWVRGTSALWPVHTYAAYCQQLKTHLDSAASSLETRVGTGGQSVRYLKILFNSWKSSVTVGHLRLYGMQLLLAGGV